MVASRIQQDRLMLTESNLYIVSGKVDPLSEESPEKTEFDACFCNNNNPATCSLECNRCLRYFRNLAFVIIFRQFHPACVGVDYLHVKDLWFCDNCIVWKQIER